MTTERATLELQTVYARMTAAYPEAYDATHGYTLHVTSLKEQLIGRARPTLLVLLGTALFVLIIACANVTNLSVTRADQRRRVLAVRASLGAGRDDRAGHPRTSDRVRPHDGRLP